MSYYLFTNAQTLILYTLKVTQKIIPNHTTKIINKIAKGGVVREESSTS